MSVTITDGGIETALVERLGQDLPEFAAFVLLDTAEGRSALREYYRPFLELAVATGTPLALDTPTWRANPDWGSVLGYDEAALARVNTEAVALTRQAAREVAPEPTAATPAAAAVKITVSGCVGPRFDEYVARERMTAAEAEAYHAPQVRALARAGVDRVSAVTMLDVAEAAGIVRAARAEGVPVVASFTVGADGLLADGTTLGEAIHALDAATDAYADGCFVNCAHPSEVARAIAGGVDHGADAVLAGTGAGPAGAGSAVARSAVVERLIGFRLNAAEHGDDGPGDAPEAFAAGVAGLRALAPAAQTFGGCCGTDSPHIAALAAALRG